jgi:hypothetical protein
MTKKRIISLVAFLFFIILFILAANYYLRHKSQKIALEETELVNNQTDQYGCLINVGYEWCELKQKCLVNKEEICDEETVLEVYLNDNISILSPIKEVLGGKFYLTKLEILEAGKGRVEYEDGHIALVGLFSFAFNGLEIQISDFIIEEEPANGLLSDIYKQTGVRLVPAGRADFIWDSDLIITGDIYEASDLKETEIERIKEYLTSNGLINSYINEDQKLGVSILGLNCILSWTNVDLDLVCGKL